MKAIIVAFLLLVTAQLQASDQCSNCTIKHLGFGTHYDDLCTSTSCVFVMINQTIPNKPACSTGSWHFTVDTSTDSGKVSLSALLAAHAANKPVNIKGSGACTNYSQTEDLRYIYF